MSGLLKNIIRFILFILVQAFVLDKVPPLYQYVKPIIYFLFILWLPFSIPRGWQMIIAFVFGLCMDYFTGTPGLHAIPCILIAYIKPFLATLLLPKETNAVPYAEPSVKSLGTAPYAIYVVLLTFIHHSCLVFIEWMQFGSFIYFIAKVAASTALSLILIFLTELLFPRKARYRTNAA